MPLLTGGLWFAAGVLSATVLPRLPMIFVSRTSRATMRLPPHPDPVPIDRELVLALLRMRRLHIWGIPLAAVPLGFGLTVLSQGLYPLALGWALGATWYLLSRLIPDEEMRWVSPIAMKDVHEINALAQGEADCCASPALRWEVSGVRCATCRTTILARARPDLGRRRADGRIAGALRLLMLDGRPLLEPEPSIPAAPTSAEE